jgi:alkylation response protein AidB-like acyl-CoA dehydrogenase
MADYYKMLDPKFKYNRAFATEEEIEMAETIRKFTDAEVYPRRHDLEGGWHRDQQLAEDTLYYLNKRFAQLGIYNSNYPEKFGGMGMPPMSRILIADEISRGDYGLGVMAGKAHWVVGLMLMAQREDLLEEFAPMFVGDDCYTPCICITEPSGGGNTEDPVQEGKNIRTIAREDGDHYVINGLKIWPGASGPHEKFQTKDLKGHQGYWIVATTDPAKGLGGIGVYYCPPDAEGLSFSEPFEKMGMVYSDENREIYFDDLRIPKRYRVDKGEPGLGARLVHLGLVGFGKLTNGARLCGAAQGALEIVLEYAKNREIVGKPEREHSLFAGSIAEMFNKLDAARQYYQGTVYMVQHPEIYGPPWSKEMLAKMASCRLLAGDACQFICNRGMELMGAYGYAYEFHIEKIARDYKIAQMWLGGYGRDRLDICQGLYGPFKWAGQEEWEKKQTLASKTKQERIKGK